MASLTLDSFIFKDNMMFLKIEGNSESKNREIPLPKDKLIRYYNKYIDFRNPKAKSFFYNKDFNQIEVSLLSEIVKRLLEFDEFSFDTMKKYNSLDELKNDNIDCFVSDFNIGGQVRSRTG